MFLFSKKYVSDKVKTYEAFLDSIDNLSAIRLRGIDMSFEVFKDKLKSYGFELTETACYGEIIDINRNQLGFYVDESRSLFSDADLKNYQYGVKFYNRFKDDFERMNQLIVEKEIIMDGYYKIKKGNEKKLRDMSNFLGYGELRKKVITEDKPEHPSREYKRIESILDNVYSGKANYTEIIEQVLKLIEPYFNERYEVKVKLENDKYNEPFDDSYGVMVFNKDRNKYYMLYEVDGFDIKKDDYTKYLKKECKYLEIYFRIIARCIKAKYSIPGPEIGRNML